MEWVMRRTVGNGENGIRWRVTLKLDDLDFADDIALISSTKQQFRDKTTKLEEARQVGLKVSTEKAKVMRINARKQEKIVVNEIDIDDLDKFTYLGAKVCKEGGAIKDLTNRLSKARGAFIRLKNIWSSERPKTTLR